MLTILRHNARCQIVGDFDTTPLGYGLHDILRERLGYENPNAIYSEQYRKNLWDGISSVYKKGTQSFPSGVLSRCTALFDELNIQYEVQDHREQPVRISGLVNNQAKYNRQLRGYQKHAIKKALEAKQGVIAVSVGGGKTTIMADLLARSRSMPVVVVVPTKALLKQTKEALETYLELDGTPVAVGIVGDGVCNIVEDGINIVTWQSCLAAFDEKYVPSKDKVVNKKIDQAKSKTWKSNKVLKTEYEEAKLKLKKAERALEPKCIDMSYREKRSFLSQELKTLKSTYAKARSALKARIKIVERNKSIKELIHNAQTLYVDESHIAAVVLESIGAKAVNAYYRWGNSATPDRPDGQSLRVEGALGPVVVWISTSELIQRGYLVPPHIFITELKSSYPGADYHEEYKLNIVHHWERNSRIAQFANEFHSNNIPTLILVEELEHGRILESMIKNAVFVPGSDKAEKSDVVDDLDNESEAHKEYRFKMLDACERNEIVLIATSWAYTGVDAPNLTALILASSMQSPVTTTQQVGRVLRKPGEHKTHAIVVDFMHAHDTFRDHAKERMKYYESEEAYVLYKAAPDRTVQKISR